MAERIEDPLFKGKDKDYVQTDGERRKAIIGLFLLAIFLVSVFAVIGLIFRFFLTPDVVCDMPPCSAQDLFHIYAGLLVFPLGPFLIIIMLPCAVAGVCFLPKLLKKKE